VALIFLPARAAAVGADGAAAEERADSAAGADSAGAAGGGRSSFAGTHAAYSDSPITPAKS